VGIFQITLEVKDSKNLATSTKKSIDVSSNYPAQPSNPFPPDKAINQSTIIQLSWDCSYTGGGILLYDVYFGLTEDPPLWLSNNQLNEAMTETLQMNSTYYWKVIAKGDQSYFTEGPIWQFTTRIDGFDFVSIYAESVDLNVTPPPNNVLINSRILATFEKELDVTSVNFGTIKLVRDYDNMELDFTTSVDGNALTIDPIENFGNGTLYILQFLDGIRSTDGKYLNPFSKMFTTEGSYVPAGVIAYWNFNDTPNEQINNTSPSGIVNLSYATSYSPNAVKAGNFDGTTTILEFANADAWMNTNDFTLSFWVKAQSAGHVNENGDPKGHYVIGLGAFKGFQFEIASDYAWCKLAASYELADATTAAEDLWFPGDGVTGQNGGWQGWTFCKDLTGSGGVASLIKDTWANVVCVYNSITREGIMYINGEKVKAFDFDLWPDGDAKRGVVGLKWGGVAPEVVNELAFGFVHSRAGTLWDNEPWGGYDFPTSNHFGGLLDDVRIFNSALTDAEVSLMYSSEKP